MSSNREAHTPKSLEAALKKSDGSVESAITIYEKQANIELKKGNKQLHEYYTLIIKDLKSALKNLAGKTHVDSKDASKQKTEKAS